MLVRIALRLAAGSEIAGLFQTLRGWVDARLALICALRWLARPTSLVTNRGLVAKRRAYREAGWFDGRLWCAGCSKSSRRGCGIYLCDLRGARWPRRRSRFRWWRHRRQSRRRDRSWRGKNSQRWLPFGKAGAPDKVGRFEVSMGRDGFDFQIRHRTGLFAVAGDIPLSRVVFRHNNPIPRRIVCP